MSLNVKTLISIILIIGLASATIYFLARDKSTSNEVDRVKTSPLKAETSSNNPISRNIKAPPSKTEETAKTDSPGTNATATFRKLYGCYYALQERAAAKNRADCSFYEGKAGYEKAYAACMDRWLDEHSSASSAEKFLANCPSDQAIVVKDYYNATKTAAKAGDGDAQLCYLAAYFVDAQGKSEYTTADVQEYKSTAPDYVSQAFKRGDWRVVTLLATRFTSPPQTLLPLLDDIGQPQTIYKMNKLLRLGATGTYASSLDSIISDYIQPTGVAQDDTIPEQKVAEANKWAQETYNQYFTGNVPLTEPPAICAPSEGGK